jgi:GNAT superfamily N-acetyltransferase
MKIKFRTSKNLEHVAGITFENMKPYYQKFAPDWDKSKVLEVTANLNNYDILCDEKVVGVMRLQFDKKQYFLRDLQILDEYKNQGLGKFALDEAKRLTKSAKGNMLQLRVLKVSPAIRLYERNGFTIQDEDERFFNMAVEVS